MEVVPKNAFHATKNEINAVLSHIVLKLDAFWFASQDQDGSASCLPCSSSSTSTANSTECKCLGLNRAFQVNKRLHRSPSLLLTILTLPAEIPVTRSKVEGCHGMGRQIVSDTTSFIYHTGWVGLVRRVARQSTWMHLSAAVSSFDSPPSCLLSCCFEIHLHVDV